MYFWINEANYAIVVPQVHVDEQEVPQFSFSSVHAFTGTHGSTVEQS